MSAEEVLNVEARESRGKRHAKRMRMVGKVPAILYGHHKESISLSVDATEFSQALRHNARLVHLKGAVSESALVKNVQWDAYGSSVLHIDLTRVDASEKVEVSLEVKLRGDAPGTKQGGVVDHATHTIDVICPAGAIPESLTLSINDLEMDQSFTADKIELPAGAELVTSADTVIVSCHEPSAASEESQVVEGAEPEVIGGRPDEDGGGE